MTHTAYPQQQPYQVRLTTTHPSPVPTTTAQQQVLSCHHKSQEAWSSERAQGTNRPAVQGYTSLFDTRISRTFAP